MAYQKKRPRRFLLHHKFAFGVFGAALLILVGIGVGFAILLSGAFSTAATKQHMALTHWMLDAGLRYSVSANSDGIRAPSLADAGMVASGQSCYRAHCAQCHGAPGIAPEALGLGMMPIPNNLAQSAREWPAEWLYYVTRKGVRMTGMPAWEYRLSEENLWATVAFLKALPSMSRADYAELDRDSPQSCSGDASSVDEHRSRGEVVLRQYACHACHRIDGIVGPDSRVGPALAGWPRRRLIAGSLPNTPDNLVRWLQDPQSISPQTLMPDLGVSEAHAREIADYLFAPQ